MLLFNLKKTSADLGFIFFCKGEFNMQKLELLSPYWSKSYSEK